MSDKQIQRIKTALSDGSCNSVYIATETLRERITLFNLESSVSLARLIRQLKSDKFRGIEYNRRTYADLGAGDIVDTPDGEGKIEFTDNLDYGYMIRGDGWKLPYKRHELILLEKADGQ